MIEAMKKSGKFTHLEQLIENGSYGDVVPQQDNCSSPVEFTSMVTGVKKEKHSIGYGKGDDKEYVKNGRIITRLDIKAKTIWEIAQEKGMNVGIYHWLLTWPPQKVNGFMICGRLSQNKNKIYPPKLRKILPPEEFEVRNKFSPSVAIQLIKLFNVDLFVGMDESAHGPNHTLWEFIEANNKKGGKEIEKGRAKFLSLYKWLDEFIKNMDENFPNSTILIVSDSGMRLADEPVYCTGSEIIELFKKLEIKMQLYAYDLYPPHLPKTHPKLYLPGRNLEEKKKIVKMLSGIKIKRNRKKFIYNIKWEKNYLSFRFNFHPSLVNYKSGHFSLILPNGEELNLWVTKLTGVSIPRGGAFIAKGPRLKEKFYVGKVRTVDIAPTILYLLNIKVPNYMDGRVLRRMIKRC